MSKLSKSVVWDKVLEGSTLIFEIPKFPYNTVWNMWKEASMPKTQLDSSSRFETIRAWLASVSEVTTLLRYTHTFIINRPIIITDGYTDRQTDTRRQHMYRVSIASRGNNLWRSKKAIYLLLVITLSVSNAHNSTMSIIVHSSGTV